MGADTSSMIELIDTHAHLDDGRLRPQIGDVLARARAEGVVQVVAIATTAEDSASVVSLAESRAGVFAAVGIHPNDAAEAGPGDWDRIVALVDHPRVVAFGETGLDRHWDRTPFPVQQEYFARHLDLAHRLDRPVVIHCREAEDDILAQLMGLGRPVKGVLHSFTGNWDQAQAFLDFGLHLSFAGMLTFANKGLDPLRDAAARAPLDRILVETDSPYLAPHPFRGKMNEPARIALTAARLAELRGLTLDDLASATTANARRLFSLPHDDLIPPDSAAGA
nr:putative metal-dependent hydrolase YcfH [uncultured bacterium]